VLAALVGCLACESDEAVAPPVAAQFLVIDLVPTEGSLEWEAAGDGRVTLSPVLSWEARFLVPSTTYADLTIEVAWLRDTDGTPCLESQAHVPGPVVMGQVKSASGAEISLATDNSPQPDPLGPCGSDYQLTTVEVSITADFVMGTTFEDQTYRFPCAYAMTHVP